MTQSCNGSFVRKAELAQVFRSDRFRHKQTFKSTKPVLLFSMSAFNKSGRSAKLDRLPLCGQSCRMLTQQTSHSPTSKIAGKLAAMQRDSSKADVQITQISRNPIRTFAALKLYVRHADKVDVCNCDEWGAGSPQKRKMMQHPDGTHFRWVRKSRNHFST